MAITQMWAVSDRRRATSFKAGEETQGEVRYGPFGSRTNAEEAVVVLLRVPMPAEKNGGGVRIVPEWVDLETGHIVAEPKAS